MSPVLIFIAISIFMLFMLLSLMAYMFPVSLWLPGSGRGQ